MWIILLPGQCLFKHDFGFPPVNGKIESVNELQMNQDRNIVYVIGAGFSVGLGFPTINNLLQNIWPRLDSRGAADDLANVIRFHHPNFNSALPDTFVNVEHLLSEMKANEQLFEYSRPAAGGFTIDDLTRHRQDFLLEIADWFHELQRKALTSPPAWLARLVERMKEEQGKREFLCAF